MQLTYKVFRLSSLSSLSSNKFKFAVKEESPEKPDFGMDDDEAKTQIAHTHDLIKGVHVQKRVSLMLALCAAAVVAFFLCVLCAAFVAAACSPMATTARCPRTSRAASSWRSSRSSHTPRASRR